MTRVARDVRDVAFSEKRQQMMLAERIEVDVLDDHHLVIIDGEQRVVQDVIDVCAIPARQESQRLFDTRGRAREPFTVGVFTELDQEAPDQILHPRILHRCYLWHRPRCRATVKVRAVQGGPQLAEDDPDALYRERTDLGQGEGRPRNLERAAGGESARFRIGLEAGSRRVLARHAGAAGGTPRRARTRHRGWTDARA